MRLGLGNSQTGKRFRKFVTRSSTKFDGTDDVITTSADSTLATKTYSFWAKSSDTGHKPVFDHGGQSIGAFHLNTFGADRPLLWLNGGWFRYFENTTKSEDGLWHHWLLLLHTDVTQSRLFCDGVELAADSTVTTSSSAHAYTTGIRIGRSTSNYFDGSLDEFAIFDGDQSALADELYNNGQPTKIRTNPNLAHWFRMGEGKLGSKSDGDSNILFQGLPTTFGSELVTNGDFSSASGWTADANAAITGGKLVLASSTGISYQTIDLEDGHAYEVTFSIENLSSGTVKAYLNGTNGTVRSANGTYTEVIIAGSSNTLVGINPSGTMDIDNFSVKKLTNVGRISGAAVKDESTAESVPKKTQNLPSAGSAKSMAFDGTDDFLTVKHHADISLEGSPATFSVWGKLDDLSGGDRKFFAKSLDTSNPSHSGYQLRTNNDALLFQIRSGGDWRTATASSFFTDLNWNHIAVTLDSSNQVRFYKNGSLFSSTALGYAIAANTNDLLIGARNPSSPAEFFKGDMDELAIWNEALDGDAIKALYNAGEPTPVITNTGAYDIYRDNLKAYYKMGDASDPAADGTSSRVDSHLFDQTNPGLGTELSVADPYTSGRWNGLGTNTPTFVAGESVRIDRPASGGDSAGGYVYLNDNSSGFLTEDLVATKVYKLTLLFETDDSNAHVRVTGGGGHHDSSTGSGVKTFYLFGFNTGGYMTFVGLDNGKFLKVSQLSLKPVNGHTGTISGATIQTEAPKQIYALPPVANTKSINFDGTNDHLVTQVDTTPANNEVRYYSWWLKNSGGSGVRIWDHGDTTKGAFQLNNGNKPLLYMATNVYQYWVDNPAQDDNEWHHWTVKIKFNDLTGCELWIDGIKQTKSSTVNSGSMDSYTTGLRIGRGGDSYFNGSIDEFSIHEDLDDESIRSLFNRGRPIDISSNHGAYDTYSDKLLHWWRMGDATSPAADGTNDIIFQGLEAEGSEEVTNGDFSNGTTGWTPAGSLQASASDGALLLTHPDAGTWYGNYLPFTSSNLVAGRTYKITFDAQYVSGTQTLRLAYNSTVVRDLSSATYDSTSRTYEAVFTATFAGSFRVFINGGTGSFKIDNVSIKQVRGQYTGPELVKADADLYKADTWTTYGDNVATFPSGTAVRIASPASGGHAAGGVVYLRAGVSGAYALTDNMETGCVYKLSFDFLTDDSDAFPRYYSGSSYTNISAGSGFKVLYFVPTGSGGVAINVDALSANKFVQFSNISVTKIGGAAVMTNMTTSDIQTDTPY